MTKPSALPIHKIDTISDLGFAIKVIRSDNSSHTPVSYAHRDDFYLFGLIENGQVDCSIDFKEYHLTKGDCMFVIPGQVHLFHKADRLDARMLIVDKAFVSEPIRYILDEAAMRYCRCKVSASEKSGLSAILNIIAERVGNLNAKCGNTVIRNLIAAYIGIVAESFMLKLKAHSNYTSRQRELYLRFKNLLSAEINSHRAPSYYAEKMNISAVYLNEVIRKVCGISVSGYIKSEIILRAKRMLCYTSLSVKEISESLGFDDASYFSRLFSETAGISPTEFRRNLG
ncbi:MAG: AraC family transcriptional regulator [Muribaculaceae bacterium]|nr:AraC family transcriptional regulator [Muribaculaceae bacterium]